MDLVGAVLIGIVLVCGGIYTTWVSWAAWQELPIRSQTPHRWGRAAALSAWLQHGATLLVSLVFLGVAASIGLSIVAGDSWAKARAELKLLSVQMLPGEQKTGNKAGCRVSFHVTALPQGNRVTGLSACYQQFSNADLEQVLANYPDIRWFLLSGTQVDDRGMSLLRSKQNLNALVLVDTAITDLGVAMLEGHPGLEELDLTQTAITDRALASVGSLPSLKHLNLRQTRVTDEGLKALRGNKTLATLDLGASRITDSVVDTLITLEHLSVVHFYEEELSSAAVDRLEHALPQCKVFIDSPPPPQEIPPAAPKAVP